MLRSAAPAILRLAIGMTTTFGTAMVPADDDVLPFSSVEFVGEDEGLRGELRPGRLEQSAAPEKTEIIHERYPDGSVKIERHVAQDEDGNYYNHGPWTLWDQQGRLIAGGEYRHGQRHGKWVKVFKATEGELFQGPFYKQFTAPFTSEASFVDGQLHGMWTVHDHHSRPVSAWEFSNGLRDGKSIWLFPNSKSWREAEFDQGEPVGALKEWDTHGKLIVDQRFVNGRRVGVQTEWFAPGQKKSEGHYLFARDVTKCTFDWWQGIARAQVTSKEGRDERHGVWAAWDRNGQKLIEGNYQHDAPVGTFNWWHANGQKSIQGSYRDGRQDGKWTWWHATGQKQIEGQYLQGAQDGKWTWWNAEGKVAESTVYTDSGNRALVDSTLQFNEPVVQSPAPVRRPTNTQTHARRASPARR